MTVHTFGTRMYSTVGIVPPTLVCGERGHVRGAVSSETSTGLSKRLVSLALGPVLDHIVVILPHHRGLSQRERMRHGAASRFHCL